MRFGNVDLHLVSDGSIWADGGPLFGVVPRVLWEPTVDLVVHDCVRSELRCLLIQTRRQRVLVDTGYGDKLSEQERDRLRLGGTRRLFRSLETVGIEPLSIDLVINTHLHTAHCGGNTRIDDDGNLAPAFPRATCCVQRLELADATFPNERTRVVYHCEDLEPVRQAGRLKVLAGDTRLSDEIRVAVTPGHTRAHQSVIIESGGQTAMFLGDLAQWPVHLERPAWVPAEDVEPQVSIETKRKIARWACEHRVLLLFAHHPEISAGYLRRTERPDRFCLEPVEMGA